MLGHAFKGTQLNPEPGHAAEALLPYPLDPLAKFGLAKRLTNAMARPWQVTAAARGIKANSTNKLSDGLLNVSNRPSDINIYVMPTVIISEQRSRNQAIASQPRRLPLNFINPMLAWRPS